RQRRPRDGGEERRDQPEVVRQQLRPKPAAQTAAQKPEARYGHGGDGGGIQGGIEDGTHDEDEGYGGQHEVADRTRRAVAVTKLVRHGALPGEHTSSARATP